MYRTFFILGLLLLFFSCRKDKNISPYEELSGGINGTVYDYSSNAFGHQMPGATGESELLFFVGNSFFRQNWVSAPASTTARDGVGPLLNARSCSSCHFKDGRGEPFVSNGDEAKGFLIRLSISGTDVNGGSIGDPNYGGQFNDLSISTVNEEGDIEVIFEYINGNYDDGTAYTLRKPIYSLTNLNYGPLDPSIMMSPRVGQQMIGLGLLEAIADQTLYALEDEMDSDGDGISGKINYVWNVQQEATTIGKFGWKANQPNLLQQTAGAFEGDLGIKSHLFPTENHTDLQTECHDLPDGGVVEIDDDDLYKTYLYCATLAVPARRNVDNGSVRSGEALFRSMDCVKCHIPNVKTGNSHPLSFLNNQHIQPFTDLLLHDMGDDLADNRPDFLASGSEWRTQPLWGIGLFEVVNGHTFLLHDGRARNIEEAILWHGGESENAKNQFKALSLQEREDLINYIKSL
jgi:CxxC motif-containing protein (DUF1111 family)